MDASLAIIAALTEDTNNLRLRYAEMVVDQAMSGPLQDLIRRREVREIVDSQLDEDALRPLFDAYVGPIVERCREILGQSADSGHDWLSPATQQAIAAMLANPAGPRFTCFSSAIEPTLLRKLLAPVFQDVLLGFVAKLPSVLANAGGLAGGADSNTRSPSGTDGGLFGRLGKEMGGRGRALMDVGRSVVSGLGIEQKLKPLAAEFSQQAVLLFRSGLRDRVRTPEGRRLVDEMVQHGMDSVLKVPLSEINADLSRIPLPKAIALLPEAVSFAADRALFSDMLDAEIDGFFDKHGQRSIGELLSEHELLDTLRPVLVRAASDHAQALFKSENFSTWLSDVLAVGNGA